MQSECHSKMTRPKSTPTRHRLERLPNLGGPRGTVAIWMMTPAPIDGLRGVPTAVQRNLRSGWYFSPWDGGRLVCLRRSTIDSEDWVVCGPSAEAGSLQAAE